MHFIDLQARYATLEIDIDAAIHRVLDHGQYIMGPEVRQLETALAERVGTRHCVTVSSGTEALLIALMALDLQPGDKVITTPFTFAATAEINAIAARHGLPVIEDAAQSFGATYRGGDQPGHSGLRSLEVLIAGYRSARVGLPLRC